MANEGSTPSAKATSPEETIRLPSTSASTTKVSRDLLGKLLKALRPDLEVSQVLGLLAQPAQPSASTMPPEPKAQEEPPKEELRGSGSRRRRYHKIVAEEEEEEEEEEEKEEENQIPGAKRPRSVRNTRPRSFPPPRAMTPPLSQTKQGRDEPIDNAEWADEEEVEEAAPVYRKVFVAVDKVLLDRATQFEDPEIKAECDARIARGRTVRSGRTLERPSLVDLRAEEEFVRYITGIGFEWLLDIDKTEVPVVLAQEFFTTFKFRHTASVTEKGVQFRIFGQTLRMSLTEWSVRLGLYTERQAEAGAWLDRDMKQPEAIADFDPQAFWESITANAPPYESTTSKATCIEHQVLRLAQVFLGCNLLGQADTTSSLTLADLYFMWCMMEQRKVHLGYWIAYTCHSIAANADHDLNMCHILGEYLRRNLDIMYNDVIPPPLCPSPKSFGISFFVRMGIVKRVNDRYFYVVDQFDGPASPTQALAIEAKKFEVEKSHGDPADDTPEKVAEEADVGRPRVELLLGQLMRTFKASKELLEAHTAQFSQAVDSLETVISMMENRPVAPDQRQKPRHRSSTTRRYTSGSAPPPKRK